MIEIIINCSVLVLYFCVPVTIFVLLSKSGLSLLSIGVFQIFFLANFIFGYVGTLPLLFGWFPQSLSEGVTRLETLSLIYVCSAWTLVSLSAGYILASKVFSYIIREKVIRNFGDSSSVFYLYILLFVAIIVFALFLFRVGGVRFADLLFGDRAFERNRILYSLPNYHWYRYFFRDLLLCVSAALFATALRSNVRSIHWMSGVSISILLMSTLATGERAPLLSAISVLAITYVMAKERGNILRPSVLMSLMIFSVAAGAMLFVSGGATTPLGLIWQFGERVFGSQLSPSYFYLEYFPLNEDFLLGRSMSNPGGVLDFTPYPLTTTIKSWQNPGLVSQGIVGSSPTIFWAELYANFGYWGVAVGPLFVGIWLSAISKLLETLPRTGAVIGLTAWCSYQLAITGTNGFFALFINTDLVVVGGLMVAAVLLPLRARRFNGSGRQSIET